ncbi:MAG: patatin-like phospholipase family protein [Patescibacteria group bacterium]|mgnify:CR=1 FL=1
MKRENLGKLGFVLGGGGFKGAWIAGILKAFLDSAFFPNYISGGSVGALVGAKMTEIIGRLEAGEPQNIILEIVDIWYNLIKIPSDIYEIDKEEAFIKPFRRLRKEHKHKLKKLFTSPKSLFMILFFEFIKAPSLYTNRKIQFLIDNLNMDKIRSASVGFDIITCDFETRGPKAWSNRAYDNETLKKALLASTALPVIFSPIEIMGAKNNDGARILPLPVVYAHRNKCDTIVAIRTDPKNHQPRKDNPDGWLADLNTADDIQSSDTADGQVRRTKRVNRDIDIYRNLKSEILEFIPQPAKEAAAEIFNSALFSFQGKKRNELYVLQPEWPLPVTTALCYPEGIKRSISLGHQGGARFLEEIGFEN